MKKANLTKTKSKQNEFKDLSDGNYISEKEVLGLMVEYLINELQLVSAEVSVDDIIDYVSFYVETDTDEELTKIAELAFSVVETLTDAGYLKKSGKSYKIVKEIYYDSNII